MTESEPKRPPSRPRAIVRQTSIDAWAIFYRGRIAFYPIHEEHGLKTPLAIFEKEEHAEAFERVILDPVDIVIEVRPVIIVL